MNEFEEALKEGMEAARIQESGELEYYYTKGEGWMARYTPPFPSYVCVIGKYRVTFEQREPEPGENFFIEGFIAGKSAPENLAKILDDNGYWANLFSTRSLEDMTQNEIPVWDPSKHGHHLGFVSSGPIVLKLEPL